MGCTESSIQASKPIDAPAPQKQTTAQLTPQEQQFL